MFPISALIILWGRKHTTHNTNFTKEWRCAIVSVPGQCRFPHHYRLYVSRTSADLQLYWFAGGTEIPAEGWNHRTRFYARRQTAWMEGKENYIAAHDIDIPIAVVSYTLPWIYLNCRNKTTKFCVSVSPREIKQLVITFLTQRYSASPSIADSTSDKRQ